MGACSSEYRNGSFRTHPDNGDELKRHDPLLVRRTALLGMLELCIQQRVAPRLACLADGSSKLPAFGDHAAGSCLEDLVQDRQYHQCQTRVLSICFLLE